jgi:hypothetical protein
MDILISFNNTYQSPGFPVLAVLNAETHEIRIVKMPYEIPDTGVLGIALSSKYLFVGLQYSFNAREAYRIPPEVGFQYNRDGILASLNPCSLLIFDRNNLQLLNQYFFEKVVDVHSLLLSPGENKLLVVSTGTDELIELELDDTNITSEKTIWRPEAGGELKDHHHLNSICYWNGDLLVSGFGKKEIANDWNSARNGFIYNISKNIFLKNGLLHPHSLAVIENQLAYCESKAKRVCFLDKADTIDLGGYSRGLCFTEGKLFVGTSTKRKISKSTGKVNKHTEDEFVGCSIQVVSHDTGLKDIIDLNNYAHEIYELLPVEGIANWPLASPINYQLKFEDAWNRQRSLAITEIKNMDLNGSTLIVIDDDVLGIDKNQFRHRKVMSFVEREGYSWGPPEDDGSAMEELKNLEVANPHLSLAFAWPSFWWFDAYPAFGDYLKSNYKQSFRNERIVIYEK